MSCRCELCEYRRQQPATGQAIMIKSPVDEAIDAIVAKKAGPIHWHREDDRTLCGVVMSTLQRTVAAEIGAPASRWDPITQHFCRRCIILAQMA